ncbi:MAG: pilin [Candidatus Falkowbacteria bacterium]
MFKKYLKFFIILLFLVFPIFVFAEAGNPPAGNPPNVSATAGTVSLTNPLTGTQTSEGIPTLLGKIINSILGIVGSLALVMFIYGGITWMLSAGNQEQVTKGKNILIWATVGIVIIFTAYALVRFVLTTVTGTNP